MKKDLTYCQTRHHEIMVELDQMDELKERENRAFTKEEVEKYEALMREDNRLNGIMEGLLTGKKLEEHREKKAKSQILRELFIKCREDKVALSEDMHDREAANGTTILLNPATGNTKGNIEASGAIPMTIHELIDTKVPGLELPGDLKILTGVEGNQVWPYAIDDVEFTIAGEVEPIGEQKINFDKLNANPEHVAAALAISNNAIDNADGASERMAATMQNNLRGSLIATKSAAYDLNVELGKSMTPALRDVNGLLTNVLNGVTGLANEYPRLTSAMAIFAGIVGAGLVALVVDAPLL